MNNKYRKFKRGIKDSTKQALGLRPGYRVQAYEYGGLAMLPLLFVVKWLAVSSIAFGVFRYAEKVIEWACK